MLLNGLSRAESNGVEALAKSKRIAMLQQKVGRLGRAGLLMTLLMPIGRLDAAPAGYSDPAGTSPPAPPPSPASPSPSPSKIKAESKG